MTRSLIIVGLILLMTACGFHLRGDNKLAEQFQLMQLIESDDVDFNTLLLQQLKLSGVTIIDDDHVALLSVQVKILPEITLAKSSSSGLEIKQLRIQVDYSVRNNNGVFLQKQKQLEQSKDFEADSDQLLAKSAEKQKLYQQMKQNLVRILIYQLQRLK